MSLQLLPQAPGTAERHAPTGDMESARQVQRRLMKVSRPRSDALEYDGRCLPAGCVGGDYFDLLDLPGGRLGLAVGDVSGKGVSAALMMASLHASLRTFYATGPAELEDALQAVNGIFRRSTSSRHYASLFLAEYDARTGTLTYANCGHVAPLLMRPDGELRRLHSTTTVLGLFHDWRPVIRRVVLAPGDTLVAFSDGLSEAAGPGQEQFGDRLLEQAALTHRHLPVSELGAAMLASCRRFAGAPQEDDMTLVVARARARDLAVPAGRGERSLVA